MSYTVSKIFIVIFCSVFMVIGGAVLLGSLSSKPNLFGLIWGGMFFFIPLVIMRSRLKQLSTFQRMTYEWYRSTHPTNVVGNRVSCFSCGNQRINVRALMNRTFHREHFCTQCGKTLYYSPEQG